LLAIARLAAYNAFRVQLHYKDERIFNGIERRGVKSKFRGGAVKEWEGRKKSLRQLFSDVLDSRSIATAT